MSAVSARLPRPAWIAHASFAFILCLKGCEAADAQDTYMTRRSGAKSLKTPLHTPRAQSKREAPAPEIAHSERLRVRNASALGISSTLYTNEMGDGGQPIDSSRKQLMQLRAGLWELHQHQMARAKALGPSKYNPSTGVCGVPHLRDPPCDHFRVLQYDLSKWANMSVRPSQLQPWHDPTKEWHVKTGTIGVIGGRVHVLYKRVTLKGYPYTDPVIASATRMLSELADEVDLPDVEIRINGADHPRFSGRNQGCLAHFFGASVASDPQACDLALPTGLRVAYDPWSEDNGSFHFNPEHAVYGATGVEKATPLTSKPYSSVFYSGSLWPSVRCGNTLETSARYHLARLSTLYPLIVNASLALVNSKQEQQVAKKYKDALQKVVVKSTPKSEHDKFRMIASAYDKCAYTGRVAGILLSESVLVKVGAPTERNVEALYGGLQDGIHFVDVNVTSGLVDKVQQLQAKPRELERIVLNANAYAAWALSHFGMKCYLLELLAGSAAKLAYRPHKKGFFHTILSNSTNQWGRSLVQARYLQGNESTAVGMQTRWGAAVHEYKNFQSQSPHRKNMNEMMKLCSHFKRIRPVPL